MMHLGWKDTIRSIVEEARPYSFGDPQRIQEWAELFVEAHQAAPGGVSLEIGTWRGGTALVFLRLLERLYPVAERPMLFTIDPYGEKPYNGGDSDDRVGLYGDADFVIMKKLLARFPNHAHFYMASEDFFAITDDYRQQAIRYWWKGQMAQVRQVTFALIDGEHDADTIEADVSYVHRLLAPHGIAVIDNIDNDPETRKRLPVCSEARSSALRRPDGATQEYAVLRAAAHQESACR